MTKNYILDTSTIISDPRCLDSFPNSNITIQIDVLNELDKLKTMSGGPGKSARVFIRLLDELSERGDVNKGVKLDNGAVVTINSKEYAHNLGDPNYTDNKILACAVGVKVETGKKPIVLTDDINLRIRARALDLDAISHVKDKSSPDDLHDGFSAINNIELGKVIHSGKSIPCNTNQQLQDLPPNECILFKDKDEKVVSLARRNCKYVNPIQSGKPWGLSSKNIEQAFAMDLMMDPSVPLVTLSGIAGTGKSLIAVACGLESVICKGTYKNLIIYRPMQPVGNAVGYLPGDLSEKLDPWMAAIKDSLEFLTTRGKGSRRGKDHWRNNLAQYSEQIHMEALTYIRGRSISNAFVLVDECQNISKEEMKTILTRIGHNTKIVLTGDVEQIDSWNLDAINNGLTYVIENFRESELAGHVTLSQGERSPLATEAARIL